MLFALSSPARTATFVVDTTADSGPGSLRQAITDANAAADADDITFAIADAGVPQIAPASDLPAITNPVTIDGTTQSPAGRVELTGTTTFGFQLTGIGITIRGFVVNGFTSAAIQITGTGSNVVEGDWLGTDVTGTVSASPPTSTGVIVGSSGDNRIGGWDAAARNVISGNGTGIFFSGVYVLPNVVVGNFIGTDATGLVALPNTGHGIQSFLGSGNTIGGTDPGAGNVIAGNSTDGIAVSGSGYDVQGNLVGIGADGVTAVPNGRHGIRLLNSASNWHIGDAAPNEIAYNTSAGVLLAVNAGTGNVIRQNSIHDNGALGIDTNGSGVNANDALDADGGANLGQNFPVLDSGFAGGSTIDGTLDSAASTSFTVDLYVSASCDPSGYGEGTEWLGAISVATDPSGHVAFTAPLARPVVGGEFVTATATDPAGNTSEFSSCAPPTGVPTTSTSTTTSSSTTAAPTTSTTAPGATITSTSTTDVSTTSTSSTSTTPDSTTSSTSTTDPSATTTSTTGAPTTTTSASVPDTSTTSSSTTLDSTTTTSTTGPTVTTTSTTALATTSTTSSDTTSTSTTGVPTTSTTATSAPDTTTTSSSTTLASTTSTTDTTTTSTSTTDTTPTTSSSTTSLASSTSTTATPSTSSTTSTTLAACTGAGCPDAGCGTAVAFAPLRCRLTSLAAVVHDTPALAPMIDHLMPSLEKALRLFDTADARCQARQRGPAKRKLRVVRRRLVQLGKQLTSKPVRRTVPTTVTAPIAARATALGVDVRSLASTLACP